VMCAVTAWRAMSAREHPTPPLRLAGLAQLGIAA
jgi:hypothetical protein